MKRKIIKSFCIYSMFLSFIFHVGCFTTITYTKKTPSNKKNKGDTLEYKSPKQILVVEKYEQIDISGKKVSLQKKKNILFRSLYEKDMEIIKKNTFFSEVYKENFTKHKNDSVVYVDIYRKTDQKKGNKAGKIAFFATLGIVPIKVTVIDSITLVFKNSTKENILTISQEKRIDEYGSTMLFWGAILLVPSLGIAILAPPLVANLLTNCVSAFRHKNMNRVFMKETLSKATIQLDSIFLSKNHIHK